MLWVLISITGLFFISLGLKKLFPSLCAICFSVFAAWLLGLLLYFLDQTFIGIDPLILALLMGGSAVGILYYLESVLPEKFFVFKLPYLLSAFAFFYFVLKLKINLSVAVFIIVLWAIFGLVFLFRNKTAGKLFKRIIECCRNW
jgi:hypothetical protein